MRSYGSSLTVLPFLLALFVLFACSGSEPTKAEAQTVPEKPNIVYVVADDLDEHLLMNAMPATKALVADRGATLANFNVTDSVCCPSRATVLLGEYVHNHKVYEVTGPNGGYGQFRQMGHDRRTLGPVLQARGYKSAMVGKLMNEYGPQTGSARRVLPGWNYWFALFNQKKYDWDANEQGRVVHYGTRPQAYSTDVLSRKARAWIKAQKGPFFAYVAPIAPHSPYVDPPRHRREFAGQPSPSRLKPSYNEDVSDKPAHIRDNPPLSARAQAEIDSRYVHRARMTLAVDDMVRGIAEDLEAAGELHNTYIFITSDNGWQAGEHRIPYSKLYPYEESTRVGMLVSGPGIAPGTKIPELTSNTDLFATFSDIAGEPENRDGRSLLPLLKGEVPAGAWRERLLLENRSALNKVRPPYYGVKGERHKYVEYANGERELYDLVADPYETQNVYPTADPTLVADLSAKLAALRTCSGASCGEAEGFSP